MQLDISKSADRYFHAIRKELHVPDGKHAELEWAVISERYKDTAAYKIREGKAYTGRVPIGFKNRENRWRKESRT